MDLLKHKLLLFFFSLVFLSTTIIPLSIAAEWSGNIATEIREFKNPGSTNQQEKRYSSIAFKPEFFHQWDNGQSFTFSAFSRASDNNESRTRVDIRELYWNYSSESWELRLGIRKVFWGVTEAQHLVDIINQTDLIEGFDREEKLGQPMANFAWIKNWGTTEFFVMPGFREQTFAGEDARLRPGLLIDASNPVYESSSAEQHVDVAARWSHYFGDWDIGLSQFYGTHREARFTPIMISSNDGSQTLKLTPNYDIIKQTGLDVQATLDSWLWKAEVIRRSGKNIDTFYASTLGLEYSYFDVYSSGIDIGLITEWLYDSRDQQATTSFANDTMLGLRIALNDRQSTEFLAGIIVDNNNKGNIFSVETSRRIGEQFKLSIEAYVFYDIAADDILAAFANDDYLQLEFAYYY